MQPYQEEYIANIKDIAVITAYRKENHCSCEEFYEQSLENRERAKELAKRNMKLLREGLFPVLDHIFDADQETLSELYDFAGQLLSGADELDGGLFCQIHRALLNLARLTKNRDKIIEELYWLGIGYYNICNKLVGLELSESRQYISQMRLCFAEAAAYIKYFDEIEDAQTRGYILRSRANMALGLFASPSEKIRMVKRTLQILQDKGYQEKEPDLPWDRYINMTHQQMAASISYSRESKMTPQDVADVMESVYIVYQKGMQEAALRHEKPPVRSRFSHCAIEHYCGLYDMKELLGRMEDLMDEADPTDFSANSMYGIISLPAFYCQFLNQYPEYLPEREEYLENLYCKIMDYVESFPEAAQNQTLYLYLRQLASTFVETKNSISYKEFILKLLMRFEPEIYLHSRVVGHASAAFCKIIIEEEPDFFDDIGMIKEASDPEEKRRLILDYAMEGGLLHDVGKFSFIVLYSQAARQWFEEEYEMAHLHTLVGETWLSERESTKRYADVALGHHCWYDGSRGYPDSYRRLECPYRQMIDIINLIDWMSTVMKSAGLYTGVERSFDETVETAITLDGRKFSPLLIARLRDPDVVERLRDAFTQGRKDAFRCLYDTQKGDSA